MKRIAAEALALALSGCAMLGGGSLEENGAGVMRGPAATATQMQAQVRSGATRAEVGALLGRANVVAFDSGWEVWVYRWPGADRSTRSATELVILFEPSGVVRKSRVRAGAPAA